MNITLKELADRVGRRASVGAGPGDPMRRDTILSIDPGTEQSGVLVLKARAPGERLPQVLAAGDMPNEEVLAMLRCGRAYPSAPWKRRPAGVLEWSTVAIEQFKALATGGRSVIPLGQSSVITIQWTGRFQEAAEWGMRLWLDPEACLPHRRDPVDIRLVTRAAVVEAHGISPREQNKDAHLQDACCRVFVEQEALEAARAHVAGKAKQPKNPDRIALRRAAVGLKATPGPLYGISGHSWQAFALALVVEKADMGDYAAT